MARERESHTEPSPEGAPTRDSTSADERIAELESRCAELNERWLRSQADYQNLRKRSQADVEASVRRVVQPLFSDLLLVLDYLDLALSAPATSDDAKSLAEGVQLTRTKLLRALDATEVEEIPTEGFFDATVHEAVGSRAADGAAPGTTLETLRKGYRWRGQVLRPARVIVAVEEDSSSEGAQPNPSRE